MEKYVFSILVSNRFGVLTRVSSMFTRRGFNIDTLTVGTTAAIETAVFGEDNFHERRRIFKNSDYQTAQ